MKLFSILIIILSFSLPAAASKKSDIGASKITIKEASNGIDLKRKRRMAIGAQAAGSLGMGGVMLELNFDPTVAISIGYGGGEGFQAVAFQGRYILGGDWLLPYAAIGYAHWATSGRSSKIETTRPNLLGERLLTDDEKQQGEFGKHLIYPAFGLQLMQLKGPYAGFSFYAEVLVLFDAFHFLAAPTGAIGMLYYF